MNRKIIFLIILILITTVFIGCQRNAPEGINKDIWQDYTEMIKILSTVYEEERLLKTKEEIEIYSQFVNFYDGNNNLNEKEKELADSIIGFKHNWELYLKYSKNENIPKEDAENEYNEAVEYYKKIKSIIND